MKKEDIIKKLEGQSDTSEFVLRSQDEENLFLENFSKSKVDSAISEVHKRYDEDLFALTGKHKDATEKTYDFMKKVFKETSGKATEFERQIDELKDQIAKNTGDKHLKTELESVQKQFSEYKTSVEAQKTDYEKKMQRTLIRGEVIKHLADFKLKPMDEEVKKIFVEKIMEDLISTAEMREEQLVFVDSEGKILRNKNNSLNPYTAKEIMAEKLKPILEAERKLEGVDFDKAVTKDKDGKVIVNLVRPDAVKTKVELGEWLIKDGGLKRNTPEYMAAYAELSKDLPMK